MSDNLINKVNQLSERLKCSEVGQKLSAGMSSMSFKMRELFQGPSHTENLIEEATAEALDEPDWATNLQLCDMINHGRLNSVEFVRGIKKRMMEKSPRVQYLTLVLLETFVNNCDKAFSEVAAEKVLGDMVKLIDNPQTGVNNRNKVLMMIESWGESSNELRYLPVYEETYKFEIKGYKFPSHDIRNTAPIFTPPRSVTSSDSSARQLHNEIAVKRFSAEQIKEAFDVARNSVELLDSVLSSSPWEDVLQDDLTITLLHQCRESQYTVQTMIETAGDNEALLFEALNVNDEIQKALSKYEDMKKPLMLPQEPEPAVILDNSPRVGKEEAQHNAWVEIHGGNIDNQMDDLGEMNFGETSGSSSEAGGVTKSRQPPKDDPVTL